MTHFYNETLSFLHRNGYKKADVAYCTMLRRSTKLHEDFEFQFSFDTFKSNADFEYHSGYGSAEIEESLKIVLNDGCWIERREYDGSEWWEFVKPPTFDSQKFIKNCNIDFHSPLRRAWDVWDDDESEWDDVQKIHIKRIEEKN